MRCTLWGITQAGQDAAADQLGLDERTVYFNPARINFRNLGHHLGIQKIHVRADKASWSDFVYCDRVANKNPKGKLPIRPDLTARDPLGRTVALEYESSLKNPVRYEEEVLPRHIERMNAEDYDHVVWICDTAKKEETLRGHLRNALEKLSKQPHLCLRRTYFAGQPKAFRVTSLALWPNFNP
jgi:hypothetical protein